MKHIVYCLVAFAFIACTNKNTNKQQTHSGQEQQYQEVAYKVAGLNDSIVSDSVWKLVFKYTEIDQMLSNPADSMLTLKVNANFDGFGELEQDIQARGLEILEKL